MMTISWLYLFAAILCEVAGTISMKFSEGLTKLIPSALLFTFYFAAFTFMALSLRKIELSVAYTIWAGVGTALVAAVGIFYFGEQASALKLASIALVIAGVVGLKLSAA
jgi:small multidrug resistance pump